MKALNIVREGFRIAGRHKRLVLVLWLAPLIPALVLGAMAASSLAPAMGSSLFADNVLTGDWFVVWTEYRASHREALDFMMPWGVAVMFVLSLLVQVVMSAGIVETLLERRADHPFVLGIRRNLLRFLRTTGVLVVLTIIVAVACRLLMKGASKLAEFQADGRIDLLGVMAAALLFIVLWAPLDLAADLSRISAARHDDRSMVRGFFRSWWAVVRRPGLFIPLFLVFLLLPLSLSGIYYALRSPWTPSTAIGIAALLVTQQAVMVVRSFFKLGFWGAEISAFRDLEEPRWCQRRTKNKQQRTKTPALAEDLGEPALDGTL